MDTPEKDLILYRLMLVAGFVGEDFSRRYARARITLTEWRVLFELHREGPDNAASIARRTGLRPMTVSRAVASLLAAKRIARSEEVADRRRHRLWLTRRGEALVQKMRPEGQKLEAALLRGVPPEARSSIDAALQAMLDEARRLAAE